mmetsp:Transcript_19523/g.26910  ORF Transcript_19523/g.26910 Transcript_19523/m.26910 type:complete len:102 (-) Transcript_19523:257-562(-)
MKFDVVQLSQSIRVFLGRQCTIRTTTFFSFHAQDYDCDYDRDYARDVQKKKYESYEKIYDEDCARYVFHQNQSILSLSQQQDIVPYLAQKGDVVELQRTKK